MLRFLRSLAWIGLLPFAVLWALAAGYRRKFLKRRAFRSRVPVISVGNIHSGGTGKSPVVRELYEALGDLNPLILSRGYRGEMSKVGAAVDLACEEGPRLFGDEPWMLAKQGARVFIGRNRVATIRKFNLESKAGLILLDDGFQHAALARRFDLVLIPAWISPGRSWCLPLGDLRESLTVLGEASAILVMGTGWVDEWEGLCRQIAPAVPLFRATSGKLQISDPEGRTVDDRSQIWGAFSGIAHPERFQTEVAPRLFEAFSDHHRYRREDIRAMIEKGRRSQVTAWLTTEKDIEKVQPFWPSDGPPLHIAKIRYRLPSDLLTAIRSSVAS